MGRDAAEVARAPKAQAMAPDVETAIRMAEDTVMEMMGVFQGPWITLSNSFPGRTHDSMVLRVLDATTCQSP